MKATVIVETSPFHSQLSVQLFPNFVAGSLPEPNNYSESVRHLTGDQMDFLRHRHVPSILLLVALAGCTQQQNAQELKEKTAQATAEVKRDAKAVAAGIREGWSRDTPLDLNAATKEQLLSLPGVTSAEADRVIAARPYNKASELLTRRSYPRLSMTKLQTWSRSRNDRRLILRLCETVKYPSAGPNEVRLRVRPES
jgi:hypothetical protein